MKQQGQSITLEEACFKNGVKIAKQKSYFVGVHLLGPTEAKRVLHLVNLEKLPSDEKEIAKYHLEEGFKSKEGSVYGIIYLNDD